MTSPAPSREIVEAIPYRSIVTRPIRKPNIEPTIAMFVSHPEADARTRVGNNSARWAANDGASIDMPNVARKIAGANSHPDVTV